MRRGRWVLLDQALSSLTNFLLSLLVARALPPPEFGTFAVVFSIYLICLGIGRSVSSDPLMVRYAAVPVALWGDGGRRALSAALAWGLSAALLVAGSGLFFDAQVRSVLIAFSIVLPGLLLQDFWRFAFFAQGRPARAAANDAVWALLLLPAAVTLSTGESSSAAVYVLAWGGSALVAGLFGFLQARTRPARGLRMWINETRHLVPSFLGEFVIVSGAGQIVALGVPLLAGLDDAGALRGAQVLVGPVNVLFMSINAFAVTEGVRVRSLTPHRFLPSMVRLSVAAGLGALVWCLIALVLPPSLGEELLGETWSQARVVLPGLLIGMTSTGLAIGAVAGFRAMEKPRAGLRVRSLLAPVVIGAGLGGAALSGAVGTAFGTGLANLVSAVWMWKAFAHLARGGTQPGERASDVAPSLPG